MKFQKPSTIYAEAATAAHELLKQIQDMAYRVDCQQATWSNAAEMQHVVAQLTEIRDFMARK